MAEAEYGATVDAVVKRKGTRKNFSFRILLFCVSWMLSETATTVAGWVNIILHGLKTLRMIIKVKEKMLKKFFRSFLLVPFFLILFIFYFC